MKPEPDAVDIPVAPNDEPTQAASEQDDGSYNERQIGDVEHMRQRAERVKRWKAMLNGEQEQAESAKPASLLSEIKDYVQTQIDGIQRSSRTDAGEAALRAFYNVLRVVEVAERRAAQPPIAESQFVGKWNHGCSGVCSTIELWVARCPHCGMPSTNEPPIAPTVVDPASLSAEKCAKILSKADHRNHGFWYAKGRFLLAGPDPSIASFVVLDDARIIATYYLEHGGKITTPDAANSR